MAKTPRLFHIVSASQFTKEFLEDIFKRADHYVEMMGKRPHSGVKQMLAGEFRNSIMFNFFYEPSTRTRFSFATAGYRLGMNVEGTDNAKLFSSAAKGESLAHTISTLSAMYPDIIIIRHHENGELAKQVHRSEVPIINAGDGSNEHPTQTLVDLYSIYRAAGRLENLRIVIGGDLKYGRTVRSLSQALCMFDGIKILFVSPPALGIDDDLRANLAFSGIEFFEQFEVNHALRAADIVYWTRTQAERATAEEMASFNPLDFTITLETMAMFKDSMKLLHPLPNAGEIAPEVDADERAFYFQQVGLGVPVRMALIEYLLENSRQDNLSLPAASQEDSSFWSRK